MSEAALAVGQRVEVTEKQVCGTVAFVGTTSFASGKWIGVILDDPKGKNNGTVKDVSYFECEDLHGIFVRQTQLTILSSGGGDSSGGSGQSSNKTSPSGAGPVGVIKKSPKPPGSPSAGRKSTGNETGSAAAKATVKSRLPSFVHNVRNVNKANGTHNDQQHIESTNTPRSGCGDGVSRLPLGQPNFITPDITLNGNSAQKNGTGGRIAFSGIPKRGVSHFNLNTPSDSQVSGQPTSKSMARTSPNNVKPDSDRRTATNSNSSSNVQYFRGTPANSSTLRNSIRGRADQSRRNDRLISNRDRRASQIKDTPSAQLNFSEIRDKLNSTLHSDKFRSTESLHGKRSGLSFTKAANSKTSPGSATQDFQKRKSLSLSMFLTPTKLREDVSASSPSLNVHLEDRPAQSVTNSGVRKRVSMSVALTPPNEAIPSYLSLRKPGLRNESPTRPQKPGLSITSTSGRPLTYSRLPVAGKEKEIPKSLQTSPSNSKISLDISTPAPGSRSSAGTNNVSLSKRASFVETIEEPIVPQYTPGTPGMSTLMSPFAPSAAATNVEDRSTAIQTIETLRGEVKDLTEKLDTLKSKRAADLEKLRELDRFRLQVETLSEFKTKVLESQAALQRDLKKAKQEAREAVEAKDAHAEEMSELSEAVEMATLDKEMAEEKTETLQLELDQANEKIAGLTTEITAIKESQASGPVSAEIMSSVPVKQLQAENARLKEALIKLRDSTAHEKHQHQKAVKDAETHKSEVVDLSKAKEKLEAHCVELEAQIADLQEQNDAALGAEEMVENLTEKNLNLEEKVTQLAEAVADLEALQDVNEQLQESAKETEMELREEHQQSVIVIQNITREIEALHETIADREATIVRFRDLVQKLKDENDLLEKNLEIESTKSIPGLTEALDFKKIFESSKAQTTAIDLELRRLEVKEVKLHVQYLNAFMPEGFIKRGGDHDSLLVLLLVPRLIGKVELLLSQVNEKLVPPALVDGINSYLSGTSQEAISSSSDIERYAFACQFSFLLHSLQSELHRWSSSLNTCSTDAFLKVGLIHPDLGVQERAVDFYLELLRKSQLDENIPLDNLEKCILAFQNFYSIHLGEEHIEPSNLVSDLCLASVAACDCVIVDVHRLIFMLKKSEKESNVSALLQDLKAISESLRQLAKKTKRYLPEPPKQPPVTTKLQSQLINDSVALAKVVKILQEGCRQAIRHAGGADGIPSAKLEEYLHLAMDKCDTRIEGSGGFEIIKEWLSTSLMTITDLAQVVNEAPVQTKEKPPTPLSLRAHAVKAELDQTRNLKIQLEDKEATIKELRQFILSKKEELSEAQIRKELAEKRLSVATKENEMTIEKLQRKVEDTTSELQRKKREFEATLEHFQQDIETLMTEKSELKDRLLSASKGLLIEGVTRKMNTPIQSPSLGGIFPIDSSTPISANLSNSAQPTSNLIEYTQFLQKQNWKLRSEEVARIIRSLPPIDLGPSQEELDENRKLYQEFYKLKGEYFATVHEGIKLLDPKIPKGRKRYLHELILQKRSNIMNQILEMKHRVKVLKVNRGFDDVILIN